MKILGIKLTHDASFTIVDGHELICCVEIEKVSNNSRNSNFILNKTEFNSLLKSYGYQLTDFDSIVIDGWRTDYLETSIFSDTKCKLRVNSYGVTYRGSTFPYEKYSFNDIEYFSTYHLESHIWSTYCTSPFAKREESSFILIWDGGMVPHLFYFDYDKKELINKGILFNIIGSIYSFFPTNFEPYKIKYSESVSLSIAGKVMAYIALGSVDKDLFNSFVKVYESFDSRINIDGLNQEVADKSAFELSNKLAFIAKAKQLKRTELSSADILATFHSFIEEVLINELTAKINSLDNKYVRNLCYAGGTALNIKWNNSIRSTNLFNDVWIPPFPNDSGISIGAACKGMIESSGNYSLNWNVYSGPAVVKGDDFHNWKLIDFSLAELARLMANTNEPVVMLNGNAELGPRALGNRSILAQPTSTAMKGILNDIKGREHYRPVAPICIEEHAPDIFIPGTPDPYMLFEHMVKEEWIEKIPAICHLDKSARLQTVNRRENEEIYTLLCEYHRLTGIPLLCNTSANFRGKGFFPDVRSVIEWGQVNFIYSDGILYYNPSLGNLILNGFEEALKGE